MAVAPDVLKVQSIKKHFGGLKAVDGVDLNVPRGEIRAIIGPNGAGKTTLFNLITGHIKPVSGSVAFHGEDIFAKPSYALCRMGLARTFQITSVFLELSVFENVQTAWFARHGKISNFFSTAKDISADEVMSILVSVGLEDQSHRQAKVLPYGDRRRLEVAIALAAEPSLLFLDEPTAGMSIQERMNMMAMVRDIAKARGLSVVFTEHDMDVVFGTAEKITVMHQGIVLIEGNPDDVRANADVRRVYLGSRG